MKAWDRADSAFLRAFFRRMKELGVNRTMSLVVTVVFSSVALCDTWIDPETDIKWKYVVTDDGAYIGNDVYSIPQAIAKETIGRIAIPSTINGHTVTGIRSRAFYECCSLTDIVIPDTVRYIGDRAFYACRSLTNLTIPVGVTEFGDGLFESCESLKNISLPGHIKEIDDAWFCNCSSLEDLMIPEGVTRIGAASFCGCSSLRNIVIPKGVSSLDCRAFANCSSLENVMIMASVISSYHCTTFEGCKSVVNVTVSGRSTLSSLFPDSYKGITNIVVSEGSDMVGYQGCKDCVSLQNVTLPESVTRIGDRAFLSCARLTTLTLPPDVTYIGMNAFSACTALTNLVFKGDAPAVSSYMFYVVPENCTATAKWGTAGWDDDGDGRWQNLPLTYYDKPVMYEAVDYDGVYDCNGHGITVRPTEPAEGVDITYSLTENGTYSSEPILFTNITAAAVNVYFKLSAEGYVESSGAATVTIRRKPDGRQYNERVDGVRWCYSVLNGRAIIGDPYGCVAVLQSTCGAIDIPSELGGCPVVGIDQSAFCKCTGLTRVTIPSGVKSIGDFAFRDCSGLMDMTIPEGVLSIGKSAFDNCGELASIQLPTSVTNIGEWAFSYCTKLTELEIPDGVTVLGRGAVSRCGRLKKVRISANVTTLEGFTFQGCAMLKRISIPFGIGFIADYAFRYSGVTDMAFEGNAPITACFAFEDVLDGCTATVCDDTTGWGEGPLWRGLRLVYRERNPIPDIGPAPTTEEIAAALKGSADDRLQRYVADGADYAAYRAWAEMVKDSDGESAGAHQVKSSPHAWLSYALGCSTLLSSEPQAGDLKIEAFNPSSSAGTFELAIGISDIPVAEDAAPDNLARVFGIEGGTSLDALSSTNVDLSFGLPEKGKVKLIVTPKDAKQSFFMKARMNL